jgi:hypothetical protein
MTAVASIAIKAANPMILFMTNLPWGKCWMPGLASGRGS